MIRSPPPLRAGSVALAVVLGASGCLTSHGIHKDEPGPGAQEQPLAQLPPRPAHVPFFDVAQAFDEELSKQPALTPPGLFRALGIVDAAEPRLSFDPTKVRHFSTIASKLKLTDEERALYRQNGVVGVDQSQRYSMGSAYYAIYARDLPVLVTSDSLLHAMHRSYDGILKHLEALILFPLVSEVLEGAHAELERRAGDLRGAMASGAEDVDLYLTVARSLLGGAGAAPETRPPSEAEMFDDAPPAKTAAARLGKQGDVEKLLALIASLQIQVPRRDDGTDLRGAKRFIDYSQFRPRGHYTESEVLRRYFRTLMWLGRPDVGFVLSPRPEERAVRPVVERERRAAALLTLLLESTGGSKRLQTMNEILDFFVGRSDSLTVSQLAAALGRAQVERPDQLTPAALEQIHRALMAAAPRRQQIRSQVLMEREDLPAVFQLFGQRFVLDSFVLAQVVHDKIPLEKQPVRRMPAGLDVMAALGNDEAVRLLAPELERYKYASNLLAARRVVDAHGPDQWSRNLYTVWLDALRTLDDVPPPGAAFPEVMRRMPWRRKQLQAQLGSWAELRHDTILYSEQSYTTATECEYPEGIVEPYPELHRRLRLFAAEAARLLESFRPALATAQAEARASSVRERQVRFLRGFAATMERIERLARKQLSSFPFTSEERSFLKKTIDSRGGGSGPPQYTGWYPRLIYGEGPDDWEPTVADVHTDPDTRQTLDVAVGDVNFVVVAIDNGRDRAAYVGPIYSYYEFTQPASKRLTDQEWRASIRSGQLPRRPGWTKAFQAPALARTLERTSR